MGVNTSVRRFACAQKCQLPVEVASLTAMMIATVLAKTLPDQRQSAGYRWASLKRGLAGALSFSWFSACRFQHYVVCCRTEQNRCDQGVRGRSMPPILNVFLFCNLRHLGGVSGRSGVTHWRASFGGRRPTHGPLLRISTRGWVNRATEPLIPRGSKCRHISPTHIAGNISSDADASPSS